MSHTDPKDQADTIVVMARPSSTLVNTRSLSYEDSDLDSIVRRQLREDVAAYKYDLDYCANQLAQDNLTPQEMRTLQMRVLDLGHKTRNAQHRLETMAATQRSAASASSSSPTSPALPRLGGGSGTGLTAKRTGTGIPGMLSHKRKASGAETPSSLSLSEKRQRIDESQSQSLDGDVRLGSVMLELTDTKAVQRLGFWVCRLCVSNKYKLAGADRQPAAPCKWPLKDIAKMMTHYLDLHTEHEPAERCKELGDALAKNRGPFQYWLGRTRAQKLGDGTVIDRAIVQLQNGAVPILLRNLSRAAAEFPNGAP